MKLLRMGPIPRNIFRLEKKVVWLVKDIEENYVSQGLPAISTNTQTLYTTRARSPFFFMIGINNADKPEINQD